MLAINLSHRLMHLSHILGGTAIQRILNHRLFGTAAPTKGQLQSWVGPHPLVKLDQTMPASQDPDEPVEQFLSGGELDLFLGDFNFCRNRLKNFNWLTFRPRPTKVAQAEKCVSANKRWVK